MNFLKLVEERYSVRQFKSKKVEEEKIEKILEAGRVAPTAVNFQPQRILVIQSEDALEKLAECTPYSFGAPLAFLVCYDKEECWKRAKFDDKSSGDIDASIVGTHMMLSAANEGIGSTWVMLFDPIKIKEVYNIPDNIEPVALFPMGYAAEDAKVNKKHYDKKAIEETVVYDYF